MLKTLNNIKQIKFYLSQFDLKKKKKNTRGIYCVISNKIYLQICIIMINKRKILIKDCIEIVEFLLFDT